MRNRFLSISALIAMLPLCSMAQSRVEYTYDNAGNRLTQYVLPDDPDRNSNSQSERQGSTQSRLLEGHTVRVTTFAGSGKVRVEVMGLDSSDNCRVEVYSLAGIQILSEKVSDTQTELDLSSCSCGIYILIVRLNSHSSSWKITNK